MQLTIIGNEGHVFSIEPHPSTFQFLQGNVGLNNIGNTSLIQVAVGDVESDTFFSCVSPNDCQNFLLRDQTENGPIRGDLKVHVKPLNDLIPNHIRINLIKIDVEGYEKFVLQGAEKLMSNTECIYIESYEKHFSSFGYSTTEILSILVKNGFSPYIFTGRDVLTALLPSHISHQCENIIAIKDPDLFMKRTGYTLN